MGWLDCEWVSVERRELGQRRFGQFVLEYGLRVIVQERPEGGFFSVFVAASLFLEPDGNAPVGCSPTVEGAVDNLRNLLKGRLVTVLKAGRGIQVKLPDEWLPEVWEVPARVPEAEAAL